MKNKSKVTKALLMLTAISALVIYSCEDDAESSASDSSSGECVNGQTTEIDDDLPNWIKDNFRCMSVTSSGSNYVFSSKGTPDHKSAYWGSSSDLYEDMPSGNTQNPNTIGEQNLVMTVPQSPDTEGSSSLMGTTGIAVNGVSIFNNAAAPGDELADEAVSFDKGNGHPAMTTYHYHVEPTYVSDDDDKMIGILLDGYTVYGRKCSSNGEVPTDLDSLHGHTTTTDDFSTATYHYHLSDDEDSGIETLISGTFKGSKGTITN